MTRATSSLMIGLGLLAAAGLLTVGWFAASLTPSGAVAVAALETIDGIPYPVVNGATVVTETLAHTDVYLTGPVLGREAALDVTFDPLDVERLEVGIRDNDFWLSYPPVLLYDAGVHKDTGQRQVTAQIPLTDKLAAADGSVDLMFFATPPGGAPDLTARVADTTQWELHALRVTVTAEDVFWFDPRAWWRLADFILSALGRERPI